MGRGRRRRGGPAAQGDGLRRLGGPDLRADRGARSALPRREWELAPDRLRVPGGESGNDVAVRVRAFLEDLHRRAPGLARAGLVPGGDPRRRPARGPGGAPRAGGRRTRRRTGSCCAWRSGTDLRDYRKRFVQAPGATSRCLRWEAGDGPEDAKLLVGQRPRSPARRRDALGLGSGRAGARAPGRVRPAPARRPARGRGGSAAGVGGRAAFFGQPGIPSRHHSRPGTARRTRDGDQQVERLERVADRRPSWRPAGRRPTPAAIDHGSAPERRVEDELAERHPGRRRPGTR